MTGKKKTFFFFKVQYNCILYTYLEYIHII